MKRGLSPAILSPAIDDRPCQTPDPSWRRTPSCWNRPASRWPPAPPAGTPPRRHPLPRQEHNLLLPVSDLCPPERSGHTHPLSDWEMAALTSPALSRRFWFFFGVVSLLPILTLATFHLQDEAQHFET